MQEVYNVKAKQLATCIMGCKYLGGAERKTQKCKLSGEDEQSSTSQQEAPPNRHNQVSQAGVG